MIPRSIDKKKKDMFFIDERQNPIDMGRTGLMR